jgi:colanic acid/amylovoran biosynthesis glycosyltransferase
MRIAHFVDWFPSVSETFILNQITGVIERGHQVEIFAQRAGDQKVVHADVRKYRLLERTRYHAVGEAGALQKTLWLAQNCKSIVQLLRRRPELFVAPRLALSPSLWRKRQIFGGAACRTYDVVHCHFGPNGILAASLRELECLQGPIVTSFYGYDMSTYLRAHGRDAYRFLFARGDLFLPLSERFERELIDLGCPADKIMVHRIGVDTRRFRAEKGRRPRQRPVRILTIARLVEKKGVAYAIEAMARLSAAYPEIDYTIIGDGPLRGQLENLICSRGLTARVHLLGWRSQEEVGEFLRNSDILLAPSVTAADDNQEGTPAVLMEALAQEVPVISTRHGAIPEVVPDALAGFLVRERDAAALADKIALMIKQRQSWPAFGVAGRKHIETHYDVEKLNDRLVGIYKSLSRAPLGVAAAG